MTISEAISKMRYELNKNNKMADAYVVAIDTMRKYQQIEQIVNAELEEYHPLDRNPYRLALIKEVLEDGND